MNITTALINAISARLAAEIHTSLPGRIESYDHTTQKANVKPLIKRKYTDGTVTSMPVIVNVPVIFPRSGGGSLTFPVSVGDGVLLIFSERSLETWLSLGDEQEPGDPRRFDLTDAIAIPGLFPFSESSHADDNESALLLLTDAKIRIKQNKFAIGRSDTDIELLDLIDQILDALIITTTATAIGPQQLSKSLDSTFLNIKTDLGTIKGDL